jgi:RNA polymerase sigma-70 factor, ECF subfamily
MKDKASRFISWEAHLVQRAARGERVAFELLIDTHRPALFSLALRMLRNYEDAKDAVQDTLVKAFRAIGDFDPERPIKPWLCRICANCCVDMVRGRKREGESLDQHEYMLQDPDEGLYEKTAGAFHRAAVIEAVGRLPEKYRKIIFMRHFRHMDVLEIANELNKPEGTIKSWLFRARAMLKKDLQVAIS